MLSKSENFRYTIFVIITDFDNTLSSKQSKSVHSNVHNLANNYVVKESSNRYLGDGP